MFEVQWWIDVWRVIISALALWTALLLTRFGVQRVVVRYRAARDATAHLPPHRRTKAGLAAADAKVPGTHPASFFALALALYSISAFRAVKLGEPPDVRLYIATGVTLLAFIGTTSRITIDWRPPWRR